MPLAPGTKVGPYEIVGRIGAGGMGEVWKARDPKLDRFVAIKVLPSNFAADAGRLKRFQQEAKALAALNHPNLVQVHEAGEHNGAPYLVMELLEGESLRDKLGGSPHAGSPHAGGPYAGGPYAGRPLAPKRAIEIAREAALGLSAAHEKGILHRDLKPENLWITRDGRVKLLDFGLAKPVFKPSSGESSTRAFGHLAVATEEGVVLGTVGYMSPEQVRGEKLDARSDLFSLGVVLWEMLTGTRPFRGGSAVETLNAILTAEPPEPDPALKVPAGLVRILDSCLAKDPAARFHSAHDLAFALGASDSLGSARLTRQSPRWRRPGWAIPLLLGAAAVIGGLGLARAFGWPPFQPPAPIAFTKLTFQPGNIHGAWLAPDGKSFLYACSVGTTPSETFLVRIDTMDARRLDLPPGAVITGGVSARGELAVKVPPIHDYTGTLARVPLAGGTPREVLENVERATWTPDGREFAVVRRVEGKARLEFPLGKVLFETPNEVPSLKFSPAGDRLALGEWLKVGSPRIRLVDLRGGVRTLDPGPGYLGVLDWDPPGKRILYSHGPDAANLSLWSMSLDGARRLLLAGPGSYSLKGVSREGRALVEHAMSRQEAVLQVGPEGSPVDLSWRNQARVRAVSAEGGSVLLVDNGDAERPPTAWLRRPGARDPILLGEGRPLGGLSPDGKWVAMLRPPAFTSLILVPTGAGDSRPVDLGGRTPAEALWHPDGRLLLRVPEPGQGKHGLHAWDVASQRLVRLREDCPALQAIDPDGTRLVASRPGGELVLLPLAGGTPTDLPIKLGTFERVRRWSQDGKSLFLAPTGWTEARGRIDRVDLRNGARTLWRQLPVTSRDIVNLTGVAITPDGRTVAYSFQRQAADDLYLVDGLQ